MTNQPDARCTAEKPVDPEGDLFSVLYKEIRGIAAGRAMPTGPGAICRTTEVINEAWIRLRRSSSSLPGERGPFLRLVAAVMRRLLIDDLRAAGSEKRGPGVFESIDVNMLDNEGGPYGADILMVDEALKALEADSPGRGRIAEMKVFGGCTNNEVAIALGISESTIKRQWRSARAYLRYALSESCGAAEQPSGGLRK